MQICCVNGKKKNLVSNSSIKDLWYRHFLDSAQLSNFIENSAEDLIDIGSGAGFPGLVLALIFLETGGPKVHLIESNKRKAAFLFEANRILQANAVIHAERSESVKNLKGDIVTARALAPLNSLIGLAIQFLKPSSQCLFLKGTNFTHELTEAQKNWRMAVTQIDSITCKDAKILKLTKVAPIA